jgi:hypothetical protein
VVVLKYVHSWFKEGRIFAASRKQDSIEFLAEGAHRALFRMGALKKPTREDTRFVKNVYEAIDPEAGLKAQARDGREKYQHFLFCILASSLEATEKEYSSMQLMVSMRTLLEMDAMPQVCQESLRQFKAARATTVADQEKASCLRNPTPC